MDQRKPHVNTKIVDDLARSVDTSSTYTTYEIINMILRIFFFSFCRHFLRGVHWNSFAYFVWCWIAKRNLCNRSTIETKEENTSAKDEIKSTSTLEYFFFLQHHPIILTQKKCCWNLLINEKYSNFFRPENLINRKLLS